MDTKLIPLNRNFIFIQVFYHHGGIKRLERFISDYFELDYEKVKNHLSYLPRDEENDSKFEVETQVDLLLDYEGNTINIELNNNNSLGIKQRNLIYLHKAAAKKYEKGKKTYEIKGKTIQINLNNFKSNQEKLVNKYRLYEEEINILYSETFRIDEVDLTLPLTKDYKYKNEWEEKIGRWCLLFNCNNAVDFKNICDKMLPREESERFVDIMKKLSSDKNYIIMENDREMLRNTIIKETREEGIELGKQEGIELGKQEGIELGVLQTAKKLLKENVDINIISKSTGLSIEEINKLK